MKHSICNFFEIMGIDMQYDINTEELEKNYLFLQRNSDDLEKCRELNVAYCTLKDPIARAEYILKLNNVEIDSYNIDKMQLLEMLEYDDVLNSDNSNRNALIKLLKMRDENMSEIKRSFNAKDYERASKGIIFIRYIDRILSKHQMV